MSREIKFRVWDGSTLKPLNMYWFAEWKCMLMQYTGVTDKNNKEIYEGDILQWQDRRGLSYALVRWNDFRAAWNFDNDNPVTPPEIAAWATVAGNIFENPYLLVWKGEQH